MIDVVYILGDGSAWQDNELRYSLRSLEKYVIDVRNVYLVGILPEFINTDKIKYIPFVDIHLFKQTRILFKILTACLEDDLSENFLFVNDDHFLLDDFVAEEFPNYHQEKNLQQTATERTVGGMYRHSLTNTVEILLKNNFSINNFDIHCPIVYNKNCFVKMCETFDWFNTPNSFVIKSLYCNVFQIQGEPMEDVKINRPMNLLEIEDYIKDKSFFSIGDLGLNQDMKLFLSNFFNKKSVYEK